MESPTSSWAGGCPDNCFGDSNAVESILIPPSVNPVQVSSPIDTPLSCSPHTANAEPSVLTFQLSNTLFGPIEDPENEQIVQSFHDIEKSADDDTDSTGSFAPSTPDSYRDMSLDSPDNQGHSGTVAGTSQSCLASTPQSSPRKLWRSGSQDVPSASTYKSRKGKKPRPKMHACLECGKKFPRPSGLVTHMNSHSGDKRMGSSFLIFVWC